VSYASFVLRVGVHGSIPFPSRVAFYYGIPEEYRQHCALCEASIRPEDDTTLLLCAASDRPRFVAEYQTVATVTALLNDDCVIGAAHNRCILFKHLITDPTIFIAFPYFQQAFPYYTYTAHFLHIDRKTKHVYIGDQQCRVLIHALDQWISDRAFPHVDPSTWIHYTLIAAIAESYRCSWRQRVFWKLTVPLVQQRDPLNWKKQVADITKNIDYCMNWTSHMTRLNFISVILNSEINIETLYPIIDYTRIRKKP